MSWYGVAYRGMVWCGLPWYGVVWCAILQCGVLLLYSGVLCCVCSAVLRFTEGRYATLCLVYVKLCFIALLLCVVCYVASGTAERNYERGEGGGA